jgi:hypothetical protein
MKSIKCRRIYLHQVEEIQNEDEWRDRWASENPLQHSPDFVRHGERGAISAYHCVPSGGPTDPTESVAVTARDLQICLGPFE